MPTEIANNNRLDGTIGRVRGEIVIDLSDGPEDLSQQPDDYLGRDGNGYLYHFPLGMLRAWAHESIEMYSPGYSWLEVPASGRFTLCWIGTTDNSPVQRFANFELNQMVVALSLEDATGSWKIVDLIVDKYDQNVDSCRSWVDIHGIAIFPYRRSLPNGVIDPMFLASQLALMEIAG